jgi:hypothetical protein
MAFSSRRGRPPRATEAVDKGTPELRQKHRRGLTQEPIDRCLAQQLIDAQQHRAALHLRWLHTVRYGAPVLTTHYQDHVQTTGDTLPETWRAAREEEYREAQRVLHQWHALDAVLRVVVYHETPVFMDTLLRERAWREPALAHALAARHACFVSGLQALHQHWHRPPAATSPHRP